MAVVHSIVRSMQLPGVSLLDLAADRAANRTVVTIAGEPDAVGEAALRGAGEAVQWIDLTRGSKNDHPRIGAADVIPFAPLRHCPLSACAMLARETAEALWSRYHVPSYLYAAAASRPDRVDIEQVRRGQFEGLREAVLRDSSRRPDAGGPGLHPTAGACAVGARPLLLEYRVTLDTAELRIARAIAREIGQRAAALGDARVVPLLAEGSAQLAVVLMRWHEAGPWQVQLAMEELAAKYKSAIVCTRLIGLLPESALQAEPEWAARLQGFDPATHLLERRLAEPLPWPGD